MNDDPTRPIQIPGFNVHVYGDTPETRASSRCGAAAIESIESNADDLYRVFVKSFEKQGYVNGLTIQVVPYDFRICALYNDSVGQIKLSLQIMKKLLKKKAVLIGHSYGNNMIHHLFKSLSGTEKQDLIEEYISLGSPVLGAIKALFYMTGSMSFLYFDQVVRWTKWKWLGHFFDGINAHYTGEMMPSLDLMFDMITNPKALSRNFDEFQNNMSFLKDNKFISSELIDQTYNDARNVFKGNFIEKQYGEVPDFKSSLYILLI